jgi:hypothetical protein
LATAISRGRRQPEIPHFFPTTASEDNIHEGDFSCNFSIFDFLLQRFRAVTHLKKTKKFSKKIFKDIFWDFIERKIASASVE